MSQKTSKITLINNVRKWEGDRGTVFYFDLEMENGDTGSIGKKSDNALKVGDSLTYTLETSERGNKIKEYKENSFGGNGGGNNGAKSYPKGGNESFALAYAKDIVCAMIAAGKTGDLKTPELTKATINIADDLFNWMENKK